jgi:hypothetical protein
MTERDNGLRFCDRRTQCASPIGTNTVGATAGFRGVKSRALDLEIVINAGSRNLAS